MNQEKTGRESGSAAKQISSTSFVDTIIRHVALEKASFHTPGHKGRTAFRGAEFAWQLDVTELPGLDDLSNPVGLLKDLEQRAARLWGSQDSFISVNGASAAVIAAICACASRADSDLIPTNCHRSVVNALVISGLSPIWYAPSKHSSDLTGGAARLESFADLIARHQDRLACALVVSPTYGGTISDIAALSDVCKQHAVPLIVDEAHGAHLIPGSGLPLSAISSGADLVIHSLHKTTPALTQTGVLHRATSCPIDAQTIRACLNLIQSSSPSYLFLASIEQALGILEDRESIQKIAQLSKVILDGIPADYSVYCDDPAHIMVRLNGISGESLFSVCCQHGVFPETVLGDHVLFLLGTSTRNEDIVLLNETLNKIANNMQSSRHNGQTPPTSRIISEQSSSDCCKQVLTPRQAFFAKSELVASADAVKRIAADCLAPCPPGLPIAVPGQRIPQNFSSANPKVRVVIEPRLQGEP